MFNNDKIKHLCQINKGYHYPPINKKDFWSSNEGYFWLTISDIEDNIYKTKRKLSTKGVQTVKEGEDLIFNKNTFVMACYGSTVGKLGWLNVNTYSSTNLINFKSNKKHLNKYLFYWFSKNINKIKFKILLGSAIPYINIKQIENLKISLPEEKEIKKIIDIIEPVEKLFLKYYKCVRIDNFKNVQKDIKILIDIIEPVEKMENIIHQLRLKIKKILILKYRLNKDELIRLKHFVDEINYHDNYDQQKNYLATNAIHELKIDFEKKFL